MAQYEYSDSRQTISFEPRKITLQYQFTSDPDDLAFIARGHSADKLVFSSEGLYSTDTATIGFNIPDTLFPEVIEWEFKTPADAYTYFTVYIWLKYALGGNNYFQFVMKGDGTFTVFEGIAVKAGSSTTFVSDTFTAGNYYPVKIYLLKEGNTDLRASVYVNESFRGDGIVYINDAGERALLKSLFIQCESYSGTYGARLRNFKITFTKI